MLGPHGPRPSEALKVEWPDPTQYAGPAQQTRSRDHHIIHVEDGGSLGTFSRLTSIESENILMDGTPGSVTYGGTLIGLRP